MDKYIRPVSAKEYGGEGSGNFGHAGRPGEVGGSGEEGSDVALSGTEKQISWAKSIKEKQEKVIDSDIFNIKKAIESDDDIPIIEYNKKRIDFLNKVKKIPSASWWIDNRGKTSFEALSATVINDREIGVKHSLWDKYLDENKFDY